MINSILYGNWIAKILLFFSAYAWMATPVILSRSAGINGNFASIILAATGLITLILFIKYYSKKTTYIPSESNFSKIDLPNLYTTLAIGIFLRIIWIYSFPATPSSDGASYLQLAQGLLINNHYETAGTRAYWPPGYPLFLVPWLKIFPSGIAITISQLFLYVVGAIGCYKLAEQYSGKRAAIIAALIFSTWPNLIALVGTPQKECVILALFPWITLWIIKPNLNAKIASGLALGFTVLVQPSLQLLLPIAVIYPILANHPKRALSATLICLAALTCITPWTLRNFIVFDKFILVSTNGGSNLYRANNEMATGGYTERGTIDLSNLGELEQDKTGKRLAVDWILSNPHSFARLAIEKQFRFMGDDSFGIYATLKTGKGTNDTSIYIFFKLLANIWWLAIWLAIALLAIQQKKPLANNLLILFWLYLFALHSAFEADGKYHIPMLWALIVWLSSTATLCHGKNRDLA